MSEHTPEFDHIEVSGRVDITQRSRTVEEWGIGFWDAERKEYRQVTFSRDYALKYLGNEGVTVIRRTRVMMPDRLTGWETVTADDISTPPG